jgi:cytochrome c biogenesis protein
LQALASARLTLWLLAILAIAMAVATLIPQRAPEEAYLKAFGTALGPLIARTTLDNIYGSWWFIGAFAALAINLLACSVRRAGQILRQDLLAGERLASGAELPGRQARWRLPYETDAAAHQLGAALQRAGYSVARLERAGDNGERRLAARKGRLSLWAPVLVHVGLVVVLIGAAWGRMPSHTYRATAVLGPGEVFAAQPPGEAFGLRLNEAGVEHSSTGQPKRYWAKLDVLEEGMIVRSQTVEPNRPLRYHGVSVTLQSIREDAPTQETAAAPAAWQVEVKAGRAAGPARSAAEGTVPIILSEDGQVRMMESSLKLADPPWFVFVAQVREADEFGHRAPAARVFVDRSGKPSHNWELVGWVGTGGLEYQGLHFQLALVGAEAAAPISQASQTYAQFALDRDVGVPIVYLGFVLVSLGGVLMLGPPHRRVTALVRAGGASAGSGPPAGGGRPSRAESRGGKGSRIALSLSPGSDQREAERLGASIESDLGGVREADPARAKEEACAR